MENSEKLTQPKPRKKRKLQEPPVDPSCPYKDPVTHAEAARLMNMTPHDARIFFERRSISAHRSSRYVSHSKQEILMKGFLWKYGSKAHCIEFSWAQKILGMSEDEMKEEMYWKQLGEKRYCTAQAIIDALYGDKT